MNNDGFDDLVVGAPFSDLGGVNSGAAYLVLGPASGTIDLENAQARLIGEAASDKAGHSIASAGDMNEDGYDDLIVGAPFNSTNGSSAGAAYLIYGPISGSFSLANAQARLPGEAAGDQAGFAVSGSRDVDGDGFADLLVGVYGNSASASTAGAAYLAYGPFDADRSLGLDSLRLSGEAGGDRAGIAVSITGDVNGDGFPDVIVGAEYGGTGGGAYVVLGRGL